jgi:hypothetical protein
MDVPLESEDVKEMKVGFKDIERVSREQIRLSPEEQKYNNIIKKILLNMRLADDTIDIMNIIKTLK